MKRTASMSLDWEKDGNDSYIAQLPPVPGYPGTWYAEIDNLTSMLDGGWYLTIFNRPNPSISVYDLPGMVMHAKTAEELMNIMEEQFTPEMIADELQAEGITPDELTASRHASRKATRRVASLDLDWEETTSTFGDTLYQAVLPSIPGYPYSGDGNSTVTIGPDFTDSRDGMYSWWMDIEVDENDNKRFTDYELTGMSGEPLDYQMGYLDGLSVEWIADKLQAEGYMPVDDD